LNPPTLNVTLGYPASGTNVTLRLQRSHGNVTLPVQSPVGVIEEPPQAIRPSSGPTSALPPPSSWGSAVPARSGGAPYGGARPPARPLTTVHGATFLGDRERRPGGHRARLGRLGDSAHRLRRKRYATDPHLCTRVRERHPERRPSLVSGPEINPVARAAPSTSSRGEPPPRYPWGAEPGAGVRSPRCSHGPQSSDPAVGDRDRRPGGHRARQGGLGDTADRCSGSGTDHVHTVASSR
jgi:hypothetical protein